MTASRSIRDVGVSITSAANPTLRRLVRLRDHRRRRRAGRILVDGWREWHQAVEAGLSLCGVYLSDPPEEPPDEFPGAAGRVFEAAERGVCFRLTPGLFERVAYGRSPRGVVAEFERPDRSLERLRLGASPLVLVLDRVEKPGNLGAVFRCADGAGVDAVILCDGSGDLFNPNAIRSSLGTVFSVPAATGTYDAVQAFLGQSGIRVLAARVESSEPHWSASLDGPLAVVLGSEAEGLGDRWRTIGGEPIAAIRIPMRGRVDSLNVSVSAALIAYEAARRRDNREDSEDRSDRQNR